MIGFILGFFVGGFFGVATISCLVAARKGDEQGNRTAIITHRGLKMDMPRG